jgi:Protein of unknown function (DUF3017)
VAANPGSLTEPTVSSQQVPWASSPGQRTISGLPADLLAGGGAGYFLVLAVCAGGLGWVWDRGSHGVQGGTLAMSGAMLLASIARLMLPESRLGMMASRKRFTDVISLAALAVGLLVAGLGLPAS